MNLKLGRGWRRRSLVVGAAATTALLAGCGNTIVGSPIALGSGAPSSSPNGSGGLSGFENQEIDWGSCRMFDRLAADYAAAAADMECGYATFPVDYADLDGDTLQLALVKLPATGSKTGSLFVNPGGPGGSGVEFAIGSASSMSELNEHFDIIGFDPRGVNNSEPQLVCETDAERDADRAEPFVNPTPEGIAVMEGRAKEAGQKCLEAAGESFLANIGTTTLVKDLDVLRAAVGDEKLNYLGYSYGTRIGAEYARQFPGHIRAMVLDGALDPSADDTASLIAQYAGFQDTLMQYAADCATAADCPLGTDPTAFTTRFQDLLIPLIDAPIRLSDGRPLTYGDALTGVIQALYSTSLWDPLTEGLQGLAHNLDPKAIPTGRYELLMALADLYNNRDDEGHYTPAEDVQMAVNCVDDQRNDDRANANYIDVEIRKQAPFTDDRRGTGLGALGACSFWPVPVTGVQEPLTPDGLPATVVVSTTHDPATPYQAGVKLAEQMGASLISFDGAQHTAAFGGEGGSRCVDLPLVAYFNDLTPVDADLKC